MALSQVPQDADPSDPLAYVSCKKWDIVATMTQGPKAEKCFTLAVSDLQTKAHDKFCTSNKHDKTLWTSFVRSSKHGSFSSLRGAAAVYDGPPVPFRLDFLDASEQNIARSNSEPQARLRVLLFADADAKVQKQKAHTTRAAIWQCGRNLYPFIHMIRMCAFLCNVLRWFWILEDILGRTKCFSGTSCGHFFPILTAIAVRVDRH